MVSVRRRGKWFRSGSSFKLVFYSTEAFEDLLKGRGQKLVKLAMASLANLVTNLDIYHLNDVYDMNAQIELQRRLEWNRRRVNLELSAKVINSSTGN